MIKCMPTIFYVPRNKLDMNVSYACGPPSVPCVRGQTQRLFMELKTATASGATVGANAVSRAVATVEATNRVLRRGAGGSSSAGAGGGLERVVDSRTSNGDTVSK